MLVVYRPSDRLGRCLLVLALSLATAAWPVAAEQWPWGPALDAVAAAPDSHRVLLENEHVRLLEVVIQPGEKEPPHTHRWPSVMLVLEGARIRYYDADGRLRFESPERTGPPPESYEPDWMGPEGLHAVENIDEHRFRALRFELKPAQP